MSRLLNYIKFRDKGKSMLNNNVKVEKEKLSPMMQHYVEVKEKIGNTLLFYQMGDFFELFFEDAEIASKELDIILTKRGKTESQNIPMCGVPIHAYENYVANLIKKNFSVAICEQTEDPIEAKKRKSIVKREITRIITPGTIIDEKMLSSRENNYLLSFYNDDKNLFAKDKANIIWIDISTGENGSFSGKIDDVISKIYALSPAEILVGRNINQDISKKLSQFHLTLRNEYQNNFDEFKRLKDKFFKNENIDDFFNDKQNDKNLSNKIVFDNSFVTNFCNIFSYVEYCLRDYLPKIIKLEKAKNFEMIIDNATSYALEIVANQKNNTKGSLYKVIDNCLHSSGSRLLKKRILAPSLDINEINERLDMVEFLQNEDEVRDAIKTYLQSLPDIYRLLMRIQTNRSGPKDLKLISIFINRYLSVQKTLGNCKKLSHGFDKLYQELGKSANILSEIEEEIENAIIDEPPLTINEGEFIRNNYNPPLDEIRTNQYEVKRKILSLQNAYIEQTNISNLKIKYNNFTGYFIEVNKEHTKKLLSDKFNKDFFHKQSLKNAVRFTTNELVDFEGKIATAKVKAIQIEIDLYNDIIETIKENYFDFINIGKILAMIDVAYSSAILAIRNNYNRPEILNHGSVVNIIDGVHPVVDVSYAKTINTCVPNNLSMEENKNIFVLTGPNMAGKSTFIRQNAIIILLAQAGFYVPAKKAEISIVDRIFARVGSHDDIYAGQSTFMIEMFETANIINHATDRSFIIFDEVGRGTSTYDGMSIALAIILYLAKSKSLRMIFATHYHELHDYCDKYENINHLTMDIDKVDQELIFLYKVKNDKGDRSYGIDVAKIAGLKNEIINDARNYLHQFENRVLQTNHVKSKNNKLHDEINIEEVNRNKEIITEINNFDIYANSPIDTVRFLEQVQSMLKKNNK